MKKVIRMYFHLEANLQYKIYSINQMKMKMMKKKNMMNKNQKGNKVKKNQ